MSDWFENVSEKVETLRKVDAKYWLHGAYEHQYRFGPTLSPEQLVDLETRYCVRLPDDYIP